MEKASLTVGVLGLRMGKRHLEAAIEYGAKVGAVCDPDPEKCREVQDELKVPKEKCFADWHDVVNCKEVDAVIIASPDMAHREQIEACLAAGKHIMCEKPLALTHEDLAAIVRMVNAHPECKFMVGQICRFTPAFVKAKELVDAGRIGELYFVESEYAHDYCKMFEGDVMNWRAHPDRNGVVGGGCHAVDLLRWIVGSDPIECFGYGTHKMLPKVPYDDANIAVMKFPGEIMGKVFVSTGCKRNYTMRTLLYGTKGTLIFNNKSPSMQLFEEDAESHDATTPQEIEVAFADHNAPAEFAYFAKMIEGSVPNIMSVEEGAKTVAACLAIVESTKLGKPVAPNYEF